MHPGTSAFHDERRLLVPLPVCPAAPAAGRVGAARHDRKRRRQQQQQQRRSRPRSLAERGLGDSRGSVCSRKRALHAFVLCNEGNSRAVAWKRKMLIRECGISTPWLSLRRAGVRATAGVLAPSEHRTPEPRFTVSPARKPRVKPRRQLHRQQQRHRRRLHRLDSLASPGVDFGRRHVPCREPGASASATRGGFTPHVSTHAPLEKWTSEGSLKDQHAAELSFGSGS
ncbi:unnamed protein product [Lampetra fluviatilis]